MTSPSATLTRLKDKLQISPPSFGSVCQESEGRVDMSCCERFQPNAIKDLGLAKFRVARSELPRG